MIKLALLGATGRMGTRICHLLCDDSRFEPVAALTCREDPRLGETINVGSKTITVTEDCDIPFDVLIDFSLPAGTIKWLELCKQTGAAMVIGATGHLDDQTKRIERAASDIAILKASNFSVGINLIKSIVGDLARRVGDDYDIEIIEHHHNQKVDAPSGTAVSLLDQIIQATGRDVSKDVVYGRSGKTGVRPTRQIGLHAVRAGDIVGIHEVFFSGRGESFSIRHTAHSRDTFARGAIEAAAWLAGKKPGLYDMMDVLDK